ncbi:peptide deformylase [Nitrospina gracilis]|uniref:peptide deformylase n=1 Tax=Nitrospina gracilis TaxID=35801 RepID=UPI001F023A7A|nr:peptide deformylase [Nitrospina gracilis Nb-211]
MAVLPIAYLGHPVLRRVAEPVDLNVLTAPGDNELQTFIDDMIDTMHDEGGVGIAAPQVQRSLRIIVVEYHGNERYPEGSEIPLEVYVNPIITWTSEETKEFWEGCLSVKDLRGLVRRPSACTMEAYTRQGEKVVVNAEGFLAVVLQHEIDHLNGKVFLDRMDDLTQLSYEKEFMTYWVKPAEEAVEPQETI